MVGNTSGAPSRSPFAAKPLARQLHLILLQHEMNMDEGLFHYSTYTTERA